jgi:hypothetical protein
MGHTEANEKHKAIAAVAQARFPGEPAAKALNLLQRHYDRIHHISRIEWLSAESPSYDDGSPVPEHLALSLLTSSKECIGIIDAHGMSTKSVDLQDADYIAELDAFAVAQEVAA